MKPRISILDRRFKYRNAASTDVRRTFRRHRLLERIKAKQESAKVEPIRKKA